MPKIEIIFKDSTAPKVIRHVSGSYTKGGFFCVRVGNLIMKYPMMHIFSVCGNHRGHLGSRTSIEKAYRKSKKAGKK